MGCLLKELFIIGVAVIVIISWSERCCCSILSTSMVMNSNNCWSLSLDTFSILIFFIVYLVVFNHLISLHFWIYCNVWVQFELLYFWVLWHIIWWTEWYNNHFLGIFTIKIPKPFPGYFLALIICTLHFTGMI